MSCEHNAFKIPCPACKPRAIKKRKKWELKMSKLSESQDWRYWIFE